MIQRIAAADFAQRRQSGESRLEALDPPALLVHGDEQRRRAYRMDLGGQPRDLLRALVIAREEDDAADLRVSEQLALLGLERDAGKVDHDWAERQR